MSDYQQLHLSTGRGRVRHCLTMVTDSVGLFLPIVLLAAAVVSSIALWPGHFVKDGASDLPVQVLEIPVDGDLSPVSAASVVEATQAVPYFDTRRSESPFWVRVQPERSASGEDVSIEFPSRHTRDIACWDAKNVTVVGYGNRGELTGRIEQLKSGFVVHLGTALSANPILCRMTFTGPARVSARQWIGGSIGRLESDFARKSGLLDGAIYMLAALMLGMSVFVRDRTYALFGVWMILNARMAALSMGADVQFFGNTFPDEYMLRSRLLTTALFSLTSVSVFFALFRRELELIHARDLAPYLQVPALILLMLSVTLPYKAYLPFLWVHTAWMVLTMFGLMAVIIVRTRSSVVILCCLAAGIALTSGLAEVLGAAFGWRWLSDNYNSTISALLSSVVCALSVGEHFRREQLERFRMQERLERNYASTPAGLFTMELDGKIISANPACLKILGEQELNEFNDRWELHFPPVALAELFSAVQVRPGAEITIGSSANDHIEAARYVCVRAALAGGVLECSLEDITERSNALRLYHHQASHDAMTNCLNRQGGESAFSEATLQHAEGKPFAFAYIQLDRFRAVHEVYGSSASDDVLRQVAASITGTAQSNARVVRVGYDNFAVIMPDTAFEMARRVCEALSLTLSTAVYRVRNKSFTVTPVTSVLEITTTMSWEDAVLTASHACARAARSGTGLICIERNSADFRIQGEIDQIGRRLQYGSMPPDAYLAVEPIFSAQSPQAAVSCELVLRTRDTANAAVPGGLIVTAAIDYECTGVLDEWMIKKATEWIESNYNRLKDASFVSVDVQSASLRDQRFIDAATETLRFHADAARIICLDIPAAGALEDVEGATRFIAHMADLGVRCVLSEFGARSTILTNLARLPVIALKLDPSVLTDGPLIDGLVALANNRGMQVIAEGVDHHLTAQDLIESGVRYLQGPAIAPPVSLTEFLADAPISRFFVTSALRTALEGTQVSMSLDTGGSPDFSRLH